MNRRAGFTLFEVLIVLAIAGMIAGLVAIGAGRSGGAARAAAIADLSVMLEGARVRAMRTASPVTVAAWADDTGALVAQQADDLPRRWDRAGIVVVDDLARPIARAEARFEPSGRTRATRWRFAAEADPTGTIHFIEFDPISGAPLPPRRSDHSTVEVPSP